ncbi:MAG: response regulator [Cocleimonas sp.]|nr:response regulator [Cocleimonas sp.]
MAAIIALTAHTTLNELQHCLKNGMNDVLIKPFKTEDLRKIAEYWLQKR